jgi:hypothetical protein
MTKSKFNLQQPKYIVDVIIISKDKNHKCFFLFFIFFFWQVHQLFCVSLFKDEQVRWEINIDSRMLSRHQPSTKGDTVTTKDYSKYILKAIIDRVNDGKQNHFFFATNSPHLCSPDELLIIFAFHPSTISL